MHHFTLDMLLKKYKHSPADNMSLDDFINKASVVVGNNTYILSDYMKSKSIDRSVIQILLDSIKNRKDYLQRFYNMSLRITDDNNQIHGMIEPMKNNEMDNNKGVVFKNIIRNLHFYDILQKTSSGLENIPTYLNIIDNLYKKNTIDYKILTPSSIHYMQKGRLGSVFSSYYFRASILNPYLIYSLNINLLKGTKIFTPTLGWSSYMVGFLESPDVKQYVGTDVIPDVCKKTEQLSSRYSKQIDIYCKPSEDLYKDDLFMKKYRGHFDVVFFSPPYYKLELYKSSNQSTTRYKSYEKWLKNYWEVTVKLCNELLEKGGRMCYILSGYGNGKKSGNYDLINDMNNITEKYFNLVSVQPMYNKNVHATKHRETGEQIMLYLKK